MSSSVGNLIFTKDRLSSGSIVVIGFVPMKDMGKSEELKKIIRFHGGSFDSAILEWIIPKDNMAALMKELPKHPDLYEAVDW